MSAPDERPEIDLRAVIAGSIAWVVAAPPLLLLACAALIVVAAIAGLQPLWASPAVSLVSAARDGDAATVYRMLKAGADPNRAGEVSISSSTNMSLTPIEAAVESRQVETLQALLKGGARLNDADRPRLICLARAATAPEIESFLQSGRPSSGPIDCSRFSLPSH